MRNEDTIGKAFSSSQPILILGGALSITHHFIPSLSSYLNENLPATLNTLTLSHIAAVIGILIFTTQASRSAGGCALTVSLAIIAWIINPYGKNSDEFIIERFLHASILGLTTVILVAHIINGAMPRRQILRRTRTTNQTQTNTNQTRERKGSSNSSYNGNSSADLVGFAAAGTVAGAISASDLSSAAHGAFYDDGVSSLNWDDHLSTNQTTFASLDDFGPSVNIDGTPMIDGTMVDVNGNAYGVTSDADFGSYNDSFTSSGSYDGLGSDW